MMEGSDLQYYLTWLKDQMKIPVRMTLNVSKSSSPSKFHGQIVSLIVSLLLFTGR